MDISEFLKLLRRQWLILLLVPVATVIITFFLVKNSPDTYVSTSQISTGITDRSGQLFSELSGQEAVVNQEFSNLIELMTMPQILNQVSYQLMLHDLTSATPFKKPSSFLNDLNKKARAHAIEVYSYKYSHQEPLYLWDDDQKGLNKLLVSMGYDAETLTKGLNITHAQYSDFVQVQYEGSSPQLTAFVVNTLCREFIAYNSSRLKENKYKAINFLKNLLDEKRIAMNNNIDILKQYKIRNRVLNLDEQAKALYFQLADYETKKEGVQKEIASKQGALSSINSKFDPKDRQYLEGTMTKINTEINVSKDRLESLNKRYIENNFNPAIGKSIDSLKIVVSDKINEAADKYIFNPMSAKQSLVEQKLNLEIELDLAKNSVGTINNEIRRLNNRFDSLVPHEAVVQGMESNIDISSKEYLEILNKYNQESMEAGFSTKLTQLNVAMPGILQPSKKMLLVILSGIISFTFCLLAMFILFFINDAIKSSQMLADKTGLPVLGYLNLIHGEAFDLNTIWNKQDVGPEIHRFKDLVRSARFELGKELGEHKVLAITSLDHKEGKTLFALNLAYSYAKINKRVLLIDGNFTNPEITQNASPKIFLEDYFSANQPNDMFTRESRITIMGNSGNNVSLFEIANQDSIAEKIAGLKSYFDIVIVDTASLIDLDRAKEWIIYADKVAGIFEYGKSLKGTRKQNVQYLKSMGDVFAGWIFNKTATKSGT